MASSGVTKKKNRFSIVVDIHLMVPKTLSSMMVTAYVDRKEYGVK